MFHDLSPVFVEMYADNAIEFSFVTALSLLEVRTMGAAAPAIVPANSALEKSAGLYRLRFQFLY